MVILNGEIFYRSFWQIQKNSACLSGSEEFAKRLQYLKMRRGVNRFVAFSA